ncbi:MAG: hypothetical protein ABL893_06055 [Hyphomicrobium sp.]
MTSELMNLLNIRMDGGAGETDGAASGARTRVGHPIAYALVVGAGGAIGLILGVIAALMLGFIEVC